MASDLEYVEFVTDQIDAECITVIGQPDRGKILVAVIDRTDSMELPEQAQIIVPPTTDNPAIRNEAAQLDQGRKKLNDRLGQLANLLGAMSNYQTELQQESQFSVAVRGALTEEHLFALQGWRFVSRDGALLSQ